MHVINEGGQRMSKEWKIGIAAALVVLSLLFLIWRCGEFAGYWV